VNKINSVYDQKMTEKINPDWLASYGVAKWHKNGG